MVYIPRDLRGSNSFNLRGRSVDEACGLDLHSLQETVVTVMPYVVCGMTAALFYGVFLAQTFLEARHRLREFERLRALIVSLDRDRKCGLPSSLALVEARAKLLQLEGELRRDGTLRSG